ncbi:MAG: glycosyltransferase [Thermodesulfobacteriota bacterium]
MRILICTYTFPPTGGPRSIRWIQFTDYLSKKGWKIDILTVSPLPRSPRYDEESLKEVPEGVSVHRTFPGILYSFTYKFFARGDSRSGKKRGSSDTLTKRILKYLNKTGRSLLIPDGSIEWLPFALRSGKKLCRENYYDALISVGYPYSSHVVGYFLKKYVHGPWLADYGDPWSFFPHYFPEWRRPIDRRLEGRLLKRMDKVIVTTEETKEGYLTFFPFLEDNDVEVIPQGYDVARFSKMEPEKAQGFRIVYTGIFYGTIREPYAFFDAVEEMEDMDIEVVIAGRIEERYREYVISRGLTGKVKFLGYLSHERVVALQKGATVLLLLGNLSRYQLPSKVYEYIASKRPILSIRYQKEDIASKIVEKYQRGVVVDNKKGEIKEALRAFYQDWKDKKLDGRFKLEDIEEYSWDSLVLRFEALLKKTCMGSNL